MKITKVEKDGGAVLLKVKVVEKDYAEAVEKELRTYRQKANMPGFRPGMVPMGVVRKMYGKGVTAEQSYRTASQAAFDYIAKNKIDYVGDIIPAEEQGDFDFDNSTEHEFIFEYGVAPEFNLELTEKDKVNYYTIKIDKKMHDAFKDSYLRRYGKLEDVTTVKDDEALTVTLDNGTLRVEDAYIGLISMSDEEKKPFIGIKKGHKGEIDINEVYKTPQQRAAMLHVKENELEGIDPKFQMEVTRIRKFVNPKIDEEFFKTAFADGSVKTKEEFEAYVDSQIGKETESESNYLFAETLKKYILDKAAIRMPEEFLKRWLVVINEGKFTKEDVEKDFNVFVRMFTWNFIERRLAEANGVKVQDEDAKALAREMIREQYRQYGLSDVKDEMLEPTVKAMLANKEQSEKIYVQALERKTLDAVKVKIKVVTKAISSEEFAKQAQALQ